MITLSDSQQKACDAFRVFLRDPSRKEFLLSGFAGTGKSFLVKYLMQLVRDEHKLIRLIAPGTPMTNFFFTATTNKAATVLQAMMSQPTRTIHQALGLVVRSNFSKGTTFLEQKNDCVELRGSVLVIDEASMINAELLNIIRKVTNKVKNCKVLYVGDSYQLSPIKENVCPIFDSAQEMYFLTDIQRQALDSPIITFSHEYRQMLDNPQKAWPDPPANSEDILHYDTPDAWREAIKDSFLVPHEVDDCKIIAWSNSRVRGYNSWIRKHMGYTCPFEEGEILLCNKPVIVRERIRAGTDTLHRVENYQQEIREDINGYQLTLGNNGDFISVFQPNDWSEADRKITALATAAKAATGDDRSDYWTRFWAIKNEWGDFRPLHAQTVHKSQGSTYREVFIDLSDIARNTKWYEVARLMYVAVTRASHKVHLYGSITDRYTRKDAMGVMEVLQNG